MSRLAFSHSKRIVDVRRGYFIVFPLGARVPRYLLELFSFAPGLVDPLAPHVFPGARLWCMELDVRTFEECRTTPMAVRYSIFSMLALLLHWML